MSLLLIDDDRRLAELVGSYLQGRGFSVSHCDTGGAGLAALAAGDFSMVILDVMLPDLDGFEVLRRIRQTSAVPVLMLTARGEDTDRIVGLELGADDYLPKPFNPRELAARLGAIGRRARSTPAPAPAAATPVNDAAVLRFGALEIDLGAREVRRAGEVRVLTAHQFEILRVLAERAGRVQSRDQLMQAVRGVDFDSFDRSIDVHISRIRAAIEDDPRRPRFVKTIRGAGYLFSPPTGREPDHGPASSEDVGEHDPGKLDDNDDNDDTDDNDGENGAGS